MAEYIEREKVIELIDYYQEDYFEVEAYFGLLKEDFLQLPSADVAPVVHGKNLDRETPSIFTCSVCGWHSWDTYCGDTSEYNYCPNCAAKMDGEDNG